MGFGEGIVYKPQKQEEKITDMTSIIIKLTRQLSKQEEKITKLEARVLNLELTDNES